MAFTTCMAKTCPGLARYFGMGADESKLPSAAQCKEECFGWAKSGKGTEACTGCGRFLSSDARWNYDPSYVLRAVNAEFEAGGHAKQHIACGCHNCGKELTAMWSPV